MLVRYLMKGAGRAVALPVLMILAATGAHAETVGQVAAKALADHPDVAEATSRWQAVGEEVEQAKAGKRPTLDVNAGIGWEHTDSPTTRGAGGSADLTRRELGVTGRQMLYDGDGVNSEIDRQQARRASAAARLESVRETVTLQAARAYVDVARYRKLRELSARSLKLHQRFLDQIRLRSEAGVGRRADLDQVNARVSLTEANLIAAEANVMDAETTFKRVVGSMPGSGFSVTPLAVDWMPKTLDDALARANAANPLLEVAEFDIAAAQAQNRAARRNNVPRFDLEAGANFNDNINGIEGEVNDASIMLRMRYNLYRGGADAARIRETAYNINEAKSVQARTHRQLEEQVRLAWVAYQATTRQLPYLTMQVQAAKATRDAYGKQFNLGQRTLLDLLNSETEVLDAETTLANASADRVLAQYRLLEAAGQLQKALGVDLAGAQAAVSR